MDPTTPTSTLVKFLLPKVPGMLLAAASHSLWLSPTSTKWDLRTTLAVDVLRQMMNTPGPSSIDKVQKLTLKDAGPKGKTWTAPATIPAPSDDGTRQAIFKAISDMGDGSEDYTKPANVDLRVEWTGYRSDAKTNDEPLPTGLTDGERYQKLMTDPGRTSKVTVLYFHGGAYYLCGFGTHREHCSKLAKACSGRVLAVEYRLAPQAAFPSQLIDALNAYLYLLYPPEGSLHDPVPASEIVFGGDSAGGNLTFALLQLLLQLRRANKDGREPTVSYNGREVPVPLPAAVFSTSPWLDISRSCPSLLTNAKYDYLPPPKEDDAKARFAKDDIWPTNPPRGDIFCDLSLLAHPLVSPLTAKDWSSSPPMWISDGDEMLYDEGVIVATRAREQGVIVQWEHYEAMPHCFNQVFPHIKTGKMAYDNIGRFARESVAGKSVQAKSTYVRAKTGDEQSVELGLGHETPFTWEKAVEFVTEAKKKRSEGYEKEAKALPKPSL